MLTIEEAIQKFEQEIPEEVQLLCGEPEVIKPLEDLEKQYNLALSPLIIFVVIGDVDIDNMEGFLENEFEMETELRKKLATEINEKVFKPLLERIDFINEHPEKTMTIEQEKAYVDNIFKKSITIELGRNPILIDAFNRRLFFILARDDNFKHRLEQALYENNEIIGSQNLIVDGQEMKPTVGNWLKDFIARYGSQTYDSVSMSSFLINSDNGKKLNNEERERLSKLIKLYTNLKFFPESMPSDDGADWQIIPYEISTKLSIKTEEPKVEKINKIKEEVKPAPKPTPEPEVAKDPLETEDTELLELKNMLLQYPAGSLERAAIEEEIKNYKKS